MTSTQAIAEFVRSIGRGQQFAALTTSVVAQAIVVLVALAVVEAGAPHWRAAAWIAGAAWVAVSAAISWRRERLSIAGIDSRFELGDRLRTWTDGVAVGGPFREWLAHDLSTRLAGLPPRAKRKPLRRRLRPLRYLLPLLLVLLVLRSLAPSFGPIGPQPTGSGGGGGGGGEGAGGAATTESPTESDPDAQQSVPQPPDRPVEEETPPDDGESEQAAPRSLLDDLPVHDDFAVPSFVGEGPSRSAEAHVAQVPDGGDAPVDTGAAGGGESEVPPEPEIDFERAAERALRSRHVRDDEREIVQRYFDLLVERSR